MKKLAGLALLIAGGIWIYNIGMSGNIDVMDVIPPAFMMIAGGFIIKS